MENRKHYLFEINSFSNDSGNLVAIEGNKTIPFAIKRVFYEYGFKGSKTRGNHANKVSRFCMIALSGSCRVNIHDGLSGTEYILDTPNKALYIDKMTWKVMSDFSSDCVLLVLSDSLYDKTEYIDNFNKFLSFVLKQA